MMINKTISQCHIENEPMKLSPLKQEMKTHSASSTVD